MVILTISGKAECGKDTTAKKIKAELEKYGYKVLVCHYADLLKYICTQFFSWDGKKDEEGRSLLQRVGTDSIRKQNPNYWVEFIKSMLTFFPDTWDYVLIPDTRFPNEIESLKKDGFIVKSIHITRPNYDNHLSNEQRNHPSETALDDFKFDYEIINPGTQDGLDHEISDFMNKIFQGNIKQQIINKIKENI